MALEVGKRCGKEEFGHERCHCGSRESQGGSSMLLLRISWLTCCSQLVGAPAISIDKEITCFHTDWLSKMLAFG